MVSEPDSARNVELVRRGFEALNREGLEGMMDLIDPEFKAITLPEVSVEPDTYRGPDGLRRYFAAFEGVMEDVRFEPEEFVACGDHVLVPCRLHARGVGTGIEVEQLFYMVWTIRDGKALRLIGYGDRDEAERVAGIRE
jgi:ketosteroid isomerase-like protein